MNYIILTLPSGNSTVYFAIFFFFGHATWHVGSSFPDQGLNLHPLHWKLGILTAGPLGRSPYFVILMLKKPPQALVCPVFVLNILFENVILRSVYFIN